MPNKKRKFKGQFNWHGEIHTIYRVSTEYGAFNTLCRGLARKLGVFPQMVTNYFIGTDRYQIQKVND